MVGRQTPILALFVPLVLVFIVDGSGASGRPGRPHSSAGVVFGIAQFVASNYISVPLTDIVASLLSAARRGAAAGVAAGRVADRCTDGGGPAAAAPRAHRAAAATGGRRGRPAPGHRAATGDGRETDATRRSPAAGRRPDHDSRGEVARAYAPYLIIIAIFVIASIAGDQARARRAGTHEFAWPGLHLCRPRAASRLVDRPSPSTGWPRPARCCSSPA